MKITAILGIALLSSTAIMAQNVGIGENAPANKLSVKGTLSVGGTYSTTAAPTDGAIIKGNVGIGNTSPAQSLTIENASGLYTGNEFVSHGLAVRTGLTSSDYILYMGADKTNANAYIQSVRISTATTNLTLNPRGGNVGVGLYNPSQALDVNGTTKTIGFQMATGAANTYILQSDASGNGSWVAPGTVSGKNIYNIDGSLTGNRVMTMGTNTLSFTTSGGAGTAQVNISNGLVVDAAGLNNGTISFANGTTTGNAVTFGTSSSEGIASNRANATAGLNQYGLDFYTSAARRMSLTNAGRLGIGTTNPQTFTEISSGTTELLKLTSTTGGAGNKAYIDFQTFAGTSVNARIGAIDMNSNNGALIFETGNAGTASTTTIERMRILNGGNVGINTTVPSNLLNVGAGNGQGIDIGNPNDQLNVSGGGSYSIRFYGYRDVVNYAIQAKITAQRTYLCCAGAGTLPWLSQGTDLVFSTNNGLSAGGSSGAPSDNSSERMRIKDNGFVGINNSNPGYMLDVNGTTNISGSGAYGRLNSSQSGNVNTTYNVNPSINASGDIRAGAGFYAFSDRRIKKAIEPISSPTALEKINKIVPVTYGFIDSFYRPDTRTIGFIAQDIEKVIPEAVSRLSDYLPNILAEAEICNIDGQMTLDFGSARSLHTGDKVKVYDMTGQQNALDIYSGINTSLYVVSAPGISEGKVFAFGSRVDDFRSVDYDKVFTVGVGAIQELSKQLAEERAKNATLEQKVSAMDRRHDQAQSDIDKLKASVETLQGIVGAKAQK